MCLGANCSAVVWEEIPAAQNSGRFRTPELSCANCALPEARVLFKFILSARRRVLKRFRGAPGTTKSVSASRFELFSPKTGEKRIAANLRANCARRLRAAIPRPRAAIPGSGKFGTTSGFSRAESVDEIFLSRSLAPAAGFVSSWRVRFRSRRSDSSTGGRVRA